MPEIAYKTNHPLTVDQFIDLLARSTLAERRPVNDRACMEGMIAHGNLLRLFRNAWRNT